MNYKERLSTLKSRLIKTDEKYLVSLEDGKDKYQSDSRCSLISEVLIVIIVGFLLFFRGVIGLVGIAGLIICV